MTATAWRRSGDTLIPTDATAKADLAKVREGASVMVELKHRRSVEQHRLFFAVLTKAADAIDSTPEKLLLAVKYQLGRFDLVKTKTGVLPYWHSIAFDKMTPADFAVFFDQALNVIAEETGITPETLRKEAGIKEMA